MTHEEALALPYPCRVILARRPDSGSDLVTVGKTYIATKYTKSQYSEIHYLHIEFGDRSGGWHPDCFEAYQRPDTTKFYADDPMAGIF